MPLAVVLGQQQRGRELVPFQFAQQFFCGHLADVARADAARQFEVFARFAEGFAAPNRSKSSPSSRPRRSTPYPCGPREIESARGPL